LLHSGSVSVEETTYFCTCEVVSDAGCVVGLLRPEVAHLFESDSTQQKSVGGGCLLLQHRRDLGEFAGVIFRSEPSARSVDDTVEGDVLLDDEYPHALHDHGGADRRVIITPGPGSHERR
jgi:hypothetical protein